MIYTSAHTSIIFTTALFAALANFWIPAEAAIYSPRLSSPPLTVVRTRNKSHFHCNYSIERCMLQIPRGGDADVLNDDVVSPPSLSDVIMEDATETSQQPATTTSTTDSSEPIVIDDAITAAANLLARRRYSFIGGTVIPLLRKIFVNQGGGNYEAGWSNMLEVFDWGDVMVVAIWAFTIEPCLHFLYVAMTTKMERAKPYTRSATSKTGKIIAHAGYIAWLTYMVELVAEFIDGFVGHNLRILDGLELNDEFFRKCPRVFAAIMYSSWIARTLNRRKSRLLYSYFNQPKYFSFYSRKYKFVATNQMLALFPLYDRCFSALIYLMAIVFVLDFTKISVGKMVQSILKFSGVSLAGLVVLALREPAERVLAGIIFLASGKVTTGEDVRFSNGDEGCITQIGWTETTVRCKSLA